MIDMLRTRRSIRKYEKKPLDKGSIDVMKEALLRSPSSRGINPWTFVFVDNPNVVERLSRSKEHGSAFLRGAPLAIVVCGDETKSDVWVEDCSIASIVAHLTAHSLGLGSCWVQIRKRSHDAGRSSEEYLRELLGLPETIAVECIVGIGRPAETKLPVPADKLQYGKVKRNRYS